MVSSAVGVNDFGMLRESETSSEMASLNDSIKDFYL